jgi:hypothetical protein
MRGCLFVLFTKLKIVEKKKYAKKNVSGQPKMLKKTNKKKKNTNNIRDDYVRDFCVVVVVTRC